mmetsp:Transcript_14451/g.2369  ORF Transcript_14451/g.2369 Transcript_14451/m.2369 type:complete len:127 (+) Transcript_14451:731-1111(+)
MLSFVSSAVFVGIYLYTRNWVCNDIIAICYTFMFLHLIQVPNLKISTILLTSAFFYDIFWVFLSSYIFGSNVMVSVATSIDLPIKIQCPKMIPTPVSFCGLIGLGDLVLPGLLVCLTARIDYIKQS